MARPARRSSATSSPISAKLPRWQCYALLLLNALTWGAALVIVKPALSLVTPFQLLWLRYTIAIVFSLPWLWQYRSYLQQWRQILPAAIGTELIGTTLALSFLYYGLSQTTAIEASLLVSTNPIFITLAGIWWLREKQNRREWLGLVLSSLGTLLLASFPLWSGRTALDGISVWGNLLIIGQNIATATYFIIAKRTYRQWPKLLMTTLGFYVGWLTFGLLALVEGGFKVGPVVTQVMTASTEPAVWIAAGYLAIFASIIGLTAYMKGQDGIEASEAGLFIYLQPLVYLPLGVFWLGEHIEWGQMAALVLIGIGVWLAEARSSLKLAS